MEIFDRCGMASEKKEHGYLIGHVYNKPDAAKMATAERRLLQHLKAGADNRVVLYSGTPVSFICQFLATAIMSYLHKYMVKPIVLVHKYEDIEIYNLLEWYQKGGWVHMEELRGLEDIKKPGVIAVICSWDLMEESGTYTSVDEMTRRCEEEKRWHVCVGSGYGLEAARYPLAGHVSASDMMWADSFAGFSLGVVNKRYEDLIGMRDGWSGQFVSNEGLLEMVAHVVEWRPAVEDAWQQYELLVRMLKDAGKKVVSLETYMKKEADYIDAMIIHMRRGARSHMIIFSLLRGRKQVYELDGDVEKVREGVYRINFLKHGAQKVYDLLMRQYGK